MVYIILSISYGNVASNQNYRASSGGIMGVKRRFFNENNCAINKGYFAISPALQAIKNPANDRAKFISIQPQIATPGRYRGTDANRPI
ncbi:hypothetical protein [Serratia odorifera]|uniref:hypothetical protein n=1 Tax=Serratia odorifera TaxID=618 RepID=UPI000FE24BE4|nr:hypothetical protein [Serratia odorifera]